MKLKPRVLVIALLSLLSTSAWAEDLFQVYQDGLANDPTFKNAQAVYLATKENLPQAWAELLPNVGLTGKLNRQRVDQDTADASVLGKDGIFYNNQKQYTLQLTQPLFNYAAWAGLKGAKATVKEAEATFNYACQDLMMRVSQAYFNVLAANDTLRYTQMQKKAIAEQLYQTQQQYAVGLIAITSVDNALASYDNMVASEIAAKVALADAMESLRQITGRTYATLAGADDKLPLLTPNPSDMEEWVRVSIEQNYNLMAYKYASIAAQEIISAQRAGHYPTVDFIGDYAYSDSTNQGNLGDVRQKILEGGLSLNLPVYEGGKINSLTRQARAEYQQALSQMELTYRNVLAGVRTSYLGVVSGISKVRADKEAIRSNQSQLDATLASYKVGTRTMVDVLNAQSSLYEAYQTYSQDQYSYLTSILQLKENAGTLSPTDIAEMNSWLKKEEPIIIDAPGVKPGTYEGTPAVPRSNIDAKTEQAVAESKRDSELASKGLATVSTENKMTVATSTKTSKLSSTSPSEEINTSGYTIELLFSRYKDHAQSFIQAQNISDKAKIVTTTNSTGEKRYEVIYGEYLTKTSAQIALDKLPADLQRLNPWIRSLADFKKSSINQ